MLLEEDEWSVRVYANPGIVGWNLGPHVYFWSGNIDMADIDPSFSSPHINVLAESELTRADARIKSLLRIVSGVSILRRGKAIKPIDSIYYYRARQKHYAKPSVTEDIGITLEELENPFDPKVVEDIRQREAERKSWSLGDKEYIPPFTEFIMDECIDNATARNILLWLALGDEELLYFITNAYKIMDSIKTDTGVHKKKSVNSSEADLKDAVAKMQEHSHYMNTKAGSGILSRHGETSHAAPTTIPSIEDMKIDLAKLVSEWFKYRFFQKYGTQPKE